MESRTGGGSGVFCLTYQEKRIAYLMGVDREKGLFEFYELWNVELWHKVLLGSSTSIEALQRRAESGDLGLFKLLRRPGGDVQKTDFDLRTATFEAVGDDEFVNVENLQPFIKVFAGQHLPKNFTIKGPEEDTLVLHRGWPLQVKGVEITKISDPLGSGL